MATRWHSRGNVALIQRPEVAGSLIDGNDGPERHRFELAPSQTAETHAPNPNLLTPMPLFDTLDISPPTADESAARWSECFSTKASPVPTNIQEMIIYRPSISVVSSEGIVIQPFDEQEWRNRCTLGFETPIVDIDYGGTWNHCRHR